MNRISLVLACVSLAFVSSFARASTEMLIWDNGEGFRPATCESLNKATIEDKTTARFSGKVVEITDAIPLANASPFPIAGSFWQLSVSNEGYDFLTCAGREYALYTVRFREQPDVAYVGVAIGSTDLFKFVSLHTPVEAQALLRGSPTHARALSERVVALDSAMEYVVCTDQSLNVRDQSLEKVLFQARALERVKVVQSFGTDEVKKVIGGKEYSFIKVQFPEKPIALNTGFVADEYVKLKGECPQATPSPTETPVVQSWTFPTIKRPSSSYKSGMRRFKASRGGGSRWHAACDLYRVTGEAAASVTSGKVIRDKYYFYEGTYAIEVKHTGGKVARYGEITGKSAPSIALNRPVTMGQTVGYIGKVNSGCCTPMLHFELYTGATTGALTQGGNKFNRRKDLIDPTTYLSEWEKAKFGTSY